MPWHPCQTAGSRPRPFEVLDAFAPVLLSFAKTVSGSLDGRLCVSGGSRRWRLLRGPQSAAPGAGLPTRSRKHQDVRQNDGGSRRGLAVLRLRCPPAVAVMQATNLGNGEDRAERWRLDIPSIGSIFLERELSTGPVIVREVRRQDSSKVTLAENDDMIQALAPD